MDDATLITRISRAAETIDENGKRIELPYSVTEAYQAALSRCLANWEREFFYGPPPKTANEKPVYGDPIMTLKDCLSVFQSELDDNELHPSDIPPLLRAAAKELLSAADERDATNAQDGVPDR